MSKKAIRRLTAPWEKKSNPIPGQEVWQSALEDNASIPPANSTERAIMAGEQSAMQDMHRGDDTLRGPASSGGYVDPADTVTREQAFRVGAPGAVVGDGAELVDPSLFSRMKNRLGMLSTGGKIGLGLAGAAGLAGTGALAHHYFGKESCVVDFHRAKTSASKQEVFDSFVQLHGGVRAISPELLNAYFPKKKVSSDLRDAGMVGFQDTDDSDLKEFYLEQAAPDALTRTMRGVGGGLFGGLGGAGIGAGIGKLLGRTGRGAGIGTGLGGAAGALLGALSDRSVRTAFDTSTGEKAGFSDLRRAFDVYDSMNPGEKPDNFFVGTRDQLQGSMGDDAPSMGYSVDLDDAIREDPLLRQNFS